MRQEATGTISADTPVDGHETSRSRVMYIVDTYPSLTETFIVREIAGLREHGIAVELFALKRGCGGTTPGGDEAAQMAESAHYPPPGASPAGIGMHLESLICHPLKYFRLLGSTLEFRIARLRSLPGSWCLFHRSLGLLRFAGNSGPIHLHAQFAFVPAAVAARVAALAGTTHSVGAHAWDIYAQSPERVVKYLAGAAFVSCCTRKGVDRLKEILPETRHADIVLVRHGLCRLPAESPRQAAPNLILGVGRLVRKKGFCDLIDACHILTMRGVKVNCLIIGDGPLFNPLNKMIAQLGLGDRVRLLGALPHESVVERLAGEAALFVMPSVVAANGDRDGLPNVILEAMAAALPVVSTTASSADEAVVDGKTGYLVPPGDAESLARRIQELLENPQMRREMGHAGRERIRHEFMQHATVLPLAGKLRALLA